MSLSSYLSQQPASDIRWQRLQGAHLFITGGSGLFGRWFLTALLEANQRLKTNIRATVLSRNPVPLQREFKQAIAQGELLLCPGDVTSFTFPQAQFTHVVHMATTSAHETFAGEDSLAKFHMLVQGTERVMQLAALQHVNRVLFTSSGVVYGASSTAPVSEHYQGAPDPCDSINGLAQGKRAAEFICSYYADRYDLGLSIARCFSFAGPGLPLDLHYAFGNFVRDALHASALTVKGDGSPMRSYLYLGDLVHWLLALLTEDDRRQVCNVGSDQAISILSLAERVQAVLAPHKPLVVEGQRAYVSGNAQRNWYVPETTLAASHYGLLPWTPLDEMIRHTAHASAA